MSYELFFFSHQGTYGTQQVVAFGQDVMVGCSKLLTAEELKQLCTSSSLSSSSSSSLTTTILNDNGTKTVVPV